MPKASAAANSEAYDCRPSRLALQIEHYPRKWDGAADELTAFCLADDVPMGIGLYLRNVVDELAHFESNKATLCRTSRQRLEALEKIEVLAAQINAHIEAMPVATEQAHLDGALRRVGIPFTDVLDEFGRIVVAGRLGHVRSVIDFLQKAAVSGRKMVKADGKSGGRREVVAHYAYFIYAVAAYCEKLAIKPGRGGKFEELCTAIFNSAGVHSTVAGHIRYYMNHYHKELISFTS